MTVLYNPSRWGRITNFKLPRVADFFAIIWDEKLKHFYWSMLGSICNYLQLNCKKKRKPFNNIYYMIDILWLHLHMILTMNHLTLNKMELNKFLRNVSINVNHSVLFMLININMALVDRTLVSEYQIIWVVH